ncbi:PREDICTED: rab11 family-interacting protein 3-like isoform X1 [Amphimedon queenslandica]|uniref:EF-hand domain-containing protein n=1 Tax=Amphimedon queenslandica TaxID=400682 RepID=A0AAN0ID81_AMPQE|nr:PREDICTED: rab11 family-interacting protein 3-like isoform X1 [Amphimedon queenslandica]|eukprot:XP_003385540.1 PREDICTED: rab11 family-interacting protein 3-like isoform X1 [Amphimedon queenslandica]
MSSTSTVDNTVTSNADQQQLVEGESETTIGSSALEQLKWIFDLCDQDHDGLITVEEFRSLGQHYLGAVSQRIDQLIHELDPKRTGVITFESFSKGIEAYLIGRRDSVTSSRSDSFSRTSFDENFPGTTSPIEDSTFTVGDVNSPTIDSPQLSYYSLGFTSSSSPVSVRVRDLEDPTGVNGSLPNGIITTSSIDTHDTFSTDEQHKPKVNGRHQSIDGIEIQPADNSPSLVARALIKRSNHSFLHVSGTGSTYSSSSEWRQDEDSDELTEKLQELSSRLEGLEVELDQSQTETMRLKKENTTLRERLDMFEDTLKDVQTKSEVAIGLVRSRSSATIDKMKKEYKSKYQELEYQLVEEKEKQSTTEGQADNLRKQIDEREMECEEKGKHVIQLQNKVTELEEELLKAKEQLRLVRNELEQDKQGLQQEVEAMNHVIQHLRKELEENKFTKKRNNINVTDYKLAEAISLKKEVQSLKEENTRLKSQLVKQGKELLGGPAPSLAAELQDAPRADVMKALTEYEEKTARLQSYIEGLLVAILDSHPELLEVK